MSKRFGRQRRRKLEAAAAEMKGLADEWRREAGRQEECRKRAEEELSRWRPKLVRRDYDDQFVVMQVGVDRRVLEMAADTKSFVAVEIENMLMDAFEKVANGTV